MKHFHSLCCEEVDFVPMQICSRKAVPLPFMQVVVWSAASMVYMGAERFTM